METDMRTMRFEDCCPLADIRDGIMLSRDGTVTIGWEVILPEETSVTREGYEDMVKVFSSAFRTLPDWAVMHRQDRFNWRTWHAERPEAFLAASFRDHFEGRRYLEHRQYLFLSVNPLREGRASVFRTFGSLSLFGGRSALAGAAPDRIREFLSKGSEFISVLEGGGITCRRLGTADLEGSGGDGGLIQSYLQLGEDGPVSEDIRRDGRGSCVETCGKRLLAWSFSSADDLPGEMTASRPAPVSSEGYEVMLSGCSPIGTELECAHVINTYVARLPQGEALSMLERRRRDMTAFSDRSAENTVNAQDIGEFIDMIHRESRTCVYTHSDILAWDTPEDELRLRGLVSAALSRMGITAKLNSYDTPVLFWAGMPGGEMELGADNWRLGELGEALCFNAYESFQRGLDGGFLRICDRRRHVPVSFDTLETAHSRGLIENYNTFVLGPSGSGKSFFTNWYIRSCVDRGAHVFVMDRGDSYETLCSVIREESGGRDGVYQTWDPDRPLSFSPFHGWRGWDDEEDGGGREFVITLLKMMWTPAGGWDAVTSPILESIVTDFLCSVEGQPEDPVFDDFYHFLGKKIMPRIKGSDRRYRPYVVGHDAVRPEDFDIQSMDKALSPFATGGRFGFLLNGREPADLFGNRFVVLEVDALSRQEEIYPLCTFCILNAFERMMRLNRTDFKLLFIDEAWSAIVGKETAGYIRNMWKTARKYHTQAVVVTQQLSDIMSSDVVQDAILGNSPVKVLLDQSGNAASFGELVRCLGLSGRDAALVKSVGRNLDPQYGREVFISLGGRTSGVFNLEVSPQERAAYESDKARKQPLIELARRRGSMIEAIREMTGYGKES